MQRISRHSFSKLKNLTVIGSGQMGSGIGLLAAKEAGLSVTMLDSSVSSLEKSKGYMTKFLDTSVTKGKLTASDVPLIMQNLTFTTEINDCKNANFVIEAITENLELKQKLLGSLDEIVTDKSCIFASNTSSISITKLANSIRNPERLIGMHFFNPPLIMNLIEIVPGLKTSKKTLETTRELALSMKKETVMSNDSPGFITNRILMPYINEAIFTLQNGVATKEDIDKAMRLGTNVPMGPLTLADFIGLDTCYYILMVLYNELKDQKFAPCPLLAKYVDAGWLGRKSGKGFFDYTPSQNK